MQNISRQSDPKALAYRAVLALLFLCIFVINIKPLEAGDFWWHLATGRWITQNMQLPQSDPFSYTVDVPDGMKLAILKSYWAAQVLFYAVYKAAGLKGIIMLRSAMFTSLYFFIFTLLKRKGLSTVASLFMILSIMPGMVVFFEMRPKIFGFLLAVAVFAIIDRMRGDKEAYKSKLLLAALPLCMVAWSNMHGGFIIGIGLIGLLMCFEAYDAMKNGFDKRFKVLASVAALSVLAASLNPMGLKLFSGQLLYGMVNKGAVKDLTLVGEIVEFMSAYDFYVLTDNKLYFFSILAFNAVLALSFVLNYRNINLFRLTVALIFMGASFLSFRYGAFLLPMSILLSGYNLRESSLPLLGLLTRENNKVRLIGGITAAALMLTMFWPGPFNTLGNDLPTYSVDFIKKSNVPTELFASYEWGGYVIWELYPEYKTFIDGRALDDKIYVLHKELIKVSPYTNQILDRYNINSVMLYNVSPLTGVATPLLFHLMKSSQWDVVFSSPKTTVFSRKGFGQQPLDKGIMWELYAKLAGSMARSRSAKASKNGFYMLGEIYFHRGMTDKARESFQQVLRIDPSNERARTYLAMMAAR